MSFFVEDQLANGLRICIEVMPQVKSAACGFLVRTGARDETPELAGVSHFLEHMCFKGTPRRSWREINIDFDEMGSYYNAFTSKDRTFYHGWVRSGDIERQLELLADLMQSVLPGDEFDTEKKVVIEEIAMSNDHIDHLAYHLLHEKAYAGSPMAWPVLGYERTVGALTRDRMHEYFARRYAPNNMVLLAAGAVDPSALIAAAKRLCGRWEPVPTKPDGRRPPAFHAGTAVQQVTRFNQQAILLAFPAASGRDEQDEDAQALAAILGGDNSRFYWNIVQAGLAPRASVWHENYEDCGLMVLYGMGDPEHAEKLAEAMQREADAVTASGVTDAEVQRVRNKRRTSLAAEAEAPYYRLSQLVEDIDYIGRPRTVEERLDRVNRVTADSIARYLQRFPITGNGYFISVGPRDWPPV